MLVACNIVWDVTHIITKDARRSLTTKINVVGVVNFPLKNKRHSNVLLDVIRIQSFANIVFMFVQIVRRIGVASVHENFVTCVTSGYVMIV